MSIHPAKQMDFDVLFSGLEAAREKGLISRRDDPTTGRAIFCYTQRCVFEKAWDQFSLVARGLILDPDERRVVATPFPKFFNIGENAAVIPEMTFEVFEKLDGSLAIIHYHRNRWRVATKGAFDSSQAQWAEARLGPRQTAAMVPGCTYLAETIYPENRIVVHYPESALVLLAVYQEDGSEIPFAELTMVGVALGWRTAKRHAFASFADLIIAARDLPATEEGFVIRFENGLRLKLKGEEYRRIHSLISRCTPLAMWEAMLAADDMVAIRRDLPEEFWADFDQITALLKASITDLEARVRAAAESVAGLSDKEVGLSLSAYPDDIRSLLFPWRKNGGQLGGRARHTLFRTIRPTGNVLPGYQPSYSMTRVSEEMT